MFFEEGEFISIEVYKIFLPVLKAGHTGLGGISSKSKDEHNGFLRMMKSNQFNNHVIEYICEKCRAKGIHDVCIHRLHICPPWIYAQDKSLEAIFGEDDEDVLRESMNIVVDSDTKCFPKHLVDRLMTSLRVRLHEPARYIVMSIDPCSGSDIPENATSQFSIVSICRPDITIARVDAITGTRPEDFDIPLVNHLKWLRAHPLFKDTPIIVDIEVNGSAVWGYIQKVIYETINSKLVFMSDCKNKDGTITSEASKLRMATRTRTCLEADEIRFLDGFACFSTSHPTEQKFMQQFKEQFMQYERIVIPSKSMRTRNSVLFSGKGPNKKKMDDICLGLQRAIDSLENFSTSPKYQRVRAQL